nr:hypothetical protein [Escherichia coli]
MFPYWEKRSMKDFINGQMTDEVKAATNTQIFSTIIFSISEITQTAQ